MGLRLLKREAVWESAGVGQIGVGAERGDIGPERARELRRLNNDPAATVLALPALLRAVRCARIVGPFADRPLLFGFHAVTGE